MRFVSDGGRVVLVIGSVSLWIGLAFLTGEDGARHSMKARSLAAYTLLGVFTAMARWVTAPASLTLLDTVLLEILIVLVHKTCRSQVGSGDLWVLAGLPLYLDGGMIWGCLLTGFLLMGAAATVIWVRKRDRTAGIPLVPFLWAGLTIMIGGVWSNGWI